MKITGITNIAYIVEVTPYELLRMSGKDRVSRSYTYPDKDLIGVKLDVDSIWNHLHHVQNSDKERVKIAESLRAAATLIENTPQTLVYPPQPVQEATAGTQERIEA